MAETVLSATEAVNRSFVFEVVEGLHSRAFASARRRFGDPTASYSEIGDRRLFILHINPESYGLQKPQAATAQPAQGVVFPDDVGFATGIINISGRFGAKERTGYDRYGQEAVLKGYGQFLEFEEFLGIYNDLSAENRDVELHFHALRSNHHFAVIPLSFQLDKDRATRIGSPRYRIRLRTYRDLGEVDPYSLFDRGLLGMPEGGIEEISKVVDEITTVVTALRHERFPSKVQRVVEFALDWSENFLNRAGEFWRSSLAILTMPFTLIDEGVRLIERAMWEVALFLHTVEDNAYYVFSIYERCVGLKELWEELKVAAHVMSTTDGGVGRTIRQMASDRSSSDRAHNDLVDSVYPDGERDADGAPTETNLAARARRSTGDALTLSDSFLADAERRYKQYSGWVPYVVREGDNPYKVAAAQYGDPNRWIDIVLANNLLHPFFGRGESVAETGDVIRLPLLRPGPSIPFEYTVEDFPSWNEELHERIYGVDFALQYNENGLLDFKPTPDLMDLDLIAGFPTFIQRLRDVLLRTERGTNVLFPNVGVVYRIGSQNLPDQTVLAVISAREVITSESAVHRIRDERVSYTGVSTSAEFDVDLLSGGPVTLKRVLT